MNGSCSWTRETQGLPAEGAARGLERGEPVYALGPPRWREKVGASSFEIDHETGGLLPLGTGSGSATEEGAE